MIKYFLTVMLFSTVALAGEPRGTPVPSTVVCHEEVTKTGAKSKDNPAGVKTKTVCVTPTPQPTKTEKTQKPVKGE